MSSRESLLRGCFDRANRQIKDSAGEMLLLDDLGRPEVPGTSLRTLLGLRAGPELQKHLIAAMLSAYGDEADTTSIVSPIDSFVTEVYEYQRTGRVRAGMLYIYRKMDEWLVQGYFDLCNAVLSNIDVNKLDTELLLGLLTITRAARDRLTEQRPAFLTRANARIEKLRGKDAAKNLLRYMAD